MYAYEEPVYLISVVAKVLNIHPQTLRQYEREGLVQPSRTDGKMRLYSQKDIDKITMILRLTRDLGVNLAGVDIILQFKEKIEVLENQVIELEKELNCIKNPNSECMSLVKTKSIYEIILFGN